MQTIKPPVSLAIINSDELSDTPDPIKRLVQSYTAALSDVAAEPIISFRSFFTLYGKLFWWELNAFVLPFVGAIDLLILLANFLRHTQRPLIRGVFIRYTVEACESLHRGEITGLKFLTLRPATSLYAQIHVKRRVDELLIFLHRAELDSMLVSPRDTDALQVLKEERTILIKFRTILKKNSELKAFLLLTPYLPLVFKLFSAEGMAKTKLWLQNPSHLRASTLTVTYLWSLLVYGLIVLASSAVRKREIMLNRGLRVTEKLAFGSLGAKPPSDLHVDIVGWILIMTLSGTQYLVFHLVRILIQPKQFGSVSYRAPMVLSFCMAFPLFYALARRIYLEQRESAPKQQATGAG